MGAGDHKVGKPFASDQHTVMGVEPDPIGRRHKAILK